MAIGKLMISFGIILISAQIASSILCLCKWTNKVNTFCCLGLHKCCPTPPPALPPPQYHIHNEYSGGSYNYPSPPAAPPPSYAAAPPMSAPAPPSPNYYAAAPPMPAPEPVPAPPKEPVASHPYPSYDVQKEADDYYYKYLYGSEHS